MLLYTYAKAIIFFFDFHMKVPDYGLILSYSWHQKDLYGAKTPNKI